jgi:hypothetical protein
MLPFLDGFSIILDSSNALQMERIYGFVSLSTFFGVAKASVDQKKTGFGGEKVWQKKEFLLQRLTRSVQLMQIGETSTTSFEILSFILIICCRCEALSRRCFLLS